MIHYDNEIKRQSYRNGRVPSNNKPMNPITEYEFWVWWGLILVARTWGRKGNVWDKAESEGEFPFCDYSEHMSQTRHKHATKT
jgi:hypothetical protein